MATTTPIETIGIGPDAPQQISRDVAQALVRICSLTAPEDRTFSSVRILTTPCGQDLYVRPSLFG